jgi:hypothetical protein
LPFASKEQLLPVKAAFNHMQPFQLDLVSEL